MVEGALNAAAELVIEKTAYGNRLERDGNRSPHVAPQGLYPGLVDETWLAVSVATDDQWIGLQHVLGDPEWARDPSLTTVEGRRARHDELDAHLEAWARERDVVEAADALLAEGVPAAAARDPRALYDHPQLRARGYYEVIDHPVVGPRATPVVPFRYASVDRWLRTPSPTLGQHNHEILVGDLGLSEERYAQLEADGIIGTWPKGL
jgi:crotonobetainyl-CoA:carnitine CoA-transferase CaiB-like acyl-CoA transferase